MAALKIAQALHPEIPFLFVSGTLGEEVAIETLKSGATDYVIKNRLERLVPSVTRAVREVEENAAACGGRRFWRVRTKNFYERMTRR